ncbi:MAG: peptidylprolyl isomerase [Candidatus Omnitrophica bacterium]|nr:peptidylprolyl isomerase [Candidatus Omnitrophota bacterium]MDD5487882.1 peptidylprolyl isomerase [Candidatus Omnitrophota bacterium]
MGRLIRLLSVVITISSIYGCANAEGGDMTVEKGRTVTFDYTLTVDGEVVDTSRGKEPLEYVQGESGLIPGLTKRMEGMRTGEERKITVPSAEAYGEIRGEAFREIPRSRLPEGMEPAAGIMLQAEQQDGGVVPVRISEVRDDVVVIDFNHPLAGKDLLFEVKIVSVK